VSRGQRGVGDVVLGDGRKRKVGTRGESFAWLTFKIHFFHFTVEVNSVNVVERFRFGKLGIKGRGKAQEAFAFFFCLGTAAVILIFYYGTYRSLLWKICARSMQLDITQLAVIVQSLKKFIKFKY
jgi:hypothetical protein